MAQEEQPVVLYDFLYRDSNRIASYYAQVFRGRLSSIEESDLRIKGLDKGSKLSAPVISSYEEKTAEATHQGVKQSIDSHDVIATDVLSFFANNGHLNSNIGDAPHGGLIISKGTLVFIDRSMYELGAASIEMLIAHEMSKPAESQDIDGMQAAGLLVNLMKQLSIPSAFLLQQSDGVQIVGTIKDDGMEEPISSYYFKHGAAGLADVYLIGLKEVPVKSIDLPETQMFGSMQQASQGLSEMLFPEGAFRVTPIALFRKFIDDATLNNLS